MERGKGEKEGEGWVEEEREASTCCAGTLRICLAWKGVREENEMSCKREL